MIPRTSLLCAFLAVLFIPSAALPAAEPVLLDDFESGQGLAERWVMQKPVSARQAAAPGDAGVDGVAGHVLRFEVTGNAGAQRRALKPAPSFDDAERVVLRMNAPEASPEKPVVFEVQFHTAKKGWWWRKVSIDRPGWQKLDLPTQWFQPGKGRLPRWEEVDRYGLWFRDAATLEIDTVELVPGDEPDAAYLSPADLAQAAFGGRPGVTTDIRDEFVLITDSPVLDADAVTAALVEMRQAVERDLPALPRAQRPVVLLVFADEAEYRAFWPGFVSKFNAFIEAPESDGFTAMGIASTSYSEKFGKVRPVYVHEACHALLAERLRIGNRGEWLHEGFAVRHTLPYSKQSLAPLVREVLDQPARRTTFEELLNGEKIPLNRYWQAASVIEWLLDDADRAARFRAAIQEMSLSGSTDLAPLAEKHFAMTRDAMEAAWLEWARGHYPE